MRVCGSCSTRLLPVDAQIQHLQLLMEQSPARGQALLALLGLHQTCCLPVPHHADYHRAAEVRSCCAALSVQRAVPAVSVMHCLALPRNAFAGKLGG